MSQNSSQFFHGADFLASNFEFQKFLDGLSNGKLREESNETTYSRSLIRSGSYLKKRETKKSAVIRRLAHDISVLEQLNFASLLDPPPLEDILNGNYK